MTTSIPGTIGSTALNPPTAPEPTRVDLQRDILSRAPGLKLYRYGTQWFYYSYGGFHYLIPPDLPGHPEVKHPITGQMVPADGTMIVRDKLGNLTHPVTRKPMGFGLISGASAMDQVSFALENWGSAGVVWLDGENDEGRKVASRKLSVRSDQLWAEAQMQTRAAFLENWGRQPQNKGKTPPPPTRLQLQAQELLDTLKDEGRTGAEYICEFGCYESSDFEKFARHMRAQHGRDLKDPSQTRKAGSPMTDGLTFEPAPAEDIGTTPMGDKARVVPIPKK